MGSAQTRRGKTTPLTCLGAGDYRKIVDHLWPENHRQFLAVIFWPGKDPRDRSRVPQARPPLTCLGAGNYRKHFDHLWPENHRRFVGGNFLAGEKIDPEGSVCLSAAGQANGNHRTLVDPPFGQKIIANLLAAISGRGKRSIPRDRMA